MVSELRPGSQDIWFGLSMARFVGVLTTGVCGEGTFGCSSALTPLVSCSSCSLGTASAASCSFICGHGAYARVGAGQALRVVKLGCRAKVRANWVLRLVRRGSNPGWNRLGVRTGLG